MGLIHVAANCESQLRHRVIASLLIGMNRLHDTGDVPIAIANCKAGFK